jgi:glutathione S-transferase
MPEIVLYQFSPVPGQDSVSPFCSKVHRLLTAKGLAYRVRNLGNPMELKKLNPRARKVPVVSWDGELLVDSSHIARVLDERVPSPPLLPKDPAARAQALLIEDWADESLYWLPVYFRWGTDRFWPEFQQLVFGKMPARLRFIVPGAARKKALAQLHGQGIGRMSEEQVLVMLDRHLAMLDGLLGDRDLLVGDALTVADIAVFAPIQAMLTPSLAPVGEHIRAHEPVMRWARRVDSLTQGEHTARLI